jgi:flagellar protein FliO/FliZ
VIFRLTFGRRLRLPRNGRARLPRLGTVDAFDLDRQRQLVIIRRDNVEHLLMIGGPNDLVIESQIIRAESRDLRDFREPRIRDKDLRDKDLREKEPRDAPPLPAGVSWPSLAETPSPNPPQRKTPVPPAAVLEPNTGVTPGVHTEEAMPGFAPPTVLPAPRPPAFPLPPRRASPPVAPSGQRISNLREPLHGRADPSQRPEPANGAAKEFRRASVAPPFLRPSTHRQAEGTAVRLAPSAESEMPPAIPNAPSSPPELNAAVETGAATAMPTIVPAASSIAAGDLCLDVAATGPAHADVDTLEAEMAKLLGRGPG